MTEQEKTKVVVFVEDILKLQTDIIDLKFVLDERDREVEDLKLMNGAIKEDFANLHDSLDEAVSRNMSLKEENGKLKQEIRRTELACNALEVENERLQSEVDRIYVLGIDCATEISELEEENQRLRTALTQIIQYHAIDEQAWILQKIARQALAREVGK